MSPRRAPIRAPELIELETLLACASDGSLSGAAERLGVSRPAVAKRIRNLESLAGRALLVRSPSGVTLTDAGAALLSGARRMLEERDALMRLLAEMQSGGPSSISGLRRLLGGEAAASRSAALPETRLADTERVLELLLRASPAGIVISNPDSGLVHEANEAFCRFAGRTRDQVVGRRAFSDVEWYESPQRRGFVEQMRQDGAIEGVMVRLRRPDGTVRAGRAGGFLVSLAGEGVMLGIVEDLGDAGAEDWRGTPREGYAPREDGQVADGDGRVAHVDVPRGPRFERPARAGARGGEPEDAGLPGRRG